jgi:signal transduction histidine kinase
MAEMRRLLGVVSRDPSGDPQLAPQPGLCSVPALVDQVRAAGTDVDLRIDGQPRTLPASVDLSAYRIVQEALTNTIKHAGLGARADVRLVFAPDWVELEISDDGTGGAETSAASGGNGLRGIADRVGALGGELAVGPDIGGRGFRVWALLPILAPAAGEPTA